MPGGAEPDAEELIAMFTSRALIEACLLVEEGVSSVRDVDLGMMTGAGLDPRRGLLPPFWKADVEGLDKVLETMEGLEAKYGERFAPPITLKRLVAQGRLGLASGQGFYPYPQPDEGEQPETVKLETRGEGAIGPPRRGGAPRAPHPADDRDLARRDSGSRHGLGAGEGDRRGRRAGRRLLGPGCLLGRRRPQSVPADGAGVR